jgi:hypothetical protein
MKNKSSSRFPSRLRVRLFATGITVLFLAAAPAGLARPLSTDDTDTLEKGLVEIENGIEYEQSKTGHETVVTPAVTYGLTTRTEVELGLDYAFEKEDGEPSAETWEPALKFKHKYWAATDGNLSLAIKGKLAFPVTTRGPDGSDDPKGYLRLLATKLTGPWQYDLNLGYKYNGAWNAGGNDVYNIGIAVRRTVSPRWQLLSEIFADIPDRSADSATALVDMAVKYKIRDGLKVDLLVGTGLGPGAIDLRIVTGLKWEF